MIKLLIIVLLSCSLIAQVNIVNSLTSYWSCLVISKSLEELHLTDSVDTNACIPGAIQSLDSDVLISYTIKF